MLTMRISSTLKEKNQTIAILFILASLLILFLFTFSSAPYYADSWYYYELAQSIGKDFFRINTYRAFQNDVPYSNAYPPLWPTLMWLGTKIIGQNYLVGYFLNFLIVLLLAIFLEFISNKYYNAPAAGFTAILGLLLFAPFTDEIINGGSIPLSLFFLILQLVIIFNIQQSVYMAFLFGIAVGLGVLARFDFLLTGLISIVLLTIFYKKWSYFLLATVGMILTISPWIYYSLDHFGVFFATDSAQVAGLVSESVVTDYYLHAPETWKDNPLAWLQRIIANIPTLMMTLIPAIITSGVFVLGSFLALAWLKNSMVPLKDRQLLSFSLRARHFAPIVILLGACIFSLPTYLMVGFFEHRYYSKLILLSCFIMSVLLAKSNSQVELSQVEDNKGIFQKLYYSRHFLIIILVLGFLVMARSIRTGVKAYNDPVSVIEQNLTNSFYSCARVEKLLDNGTTLVWKYDRLAARIGALTGIRVAMMPRNFIRFNHDEMTAFLAKYDIQYILSAGSSYKELKDILEPNNIFLHKVERCHQIDLYKLMPLSQS